MTGSCLFTRGNSARFTSLGTRWGEGQEGEGVHTRSAWVKCRLLARGKEEGEEEKLGILYFVMLLFRFYFGDGILFL